MKRKDLLMLTLSIVMIAMGVILERFVLEPYRVEQNEMVEPELTGQILHDSYNVSHLAIAFTHDKIEIGDTLFYIVKNDSMILCHTNNKWLKRSYR